MPEEMVTVEMEAPGGPEVLRPGRRAIPVPGPNEVLIRVAAAGLNGADLSQRRGGYPAPAGSSDLIGLEVGGTVAALGPGVAGFAVGDRVAALLAGGGYAGYCAAPAGQVLPLPKGFDLLQGAAIMEVACTVWANLFEAAALKPGETILVHGGTSGIGTTAIQLARALGSEVLATAGTADKVATCRALGARRAINYREEDFEAVVAAETTGGVDVILDIVGGSYLERNIRCLAPGGRLSCISLRGGRSGPLDISRVMRQRLAVLGSTLRSRPLPEKARLVVEVRKHVWPLYESGAVKPVLDRVFPYTEAAEAHRRMEASEHTGKILLSFG